MIHIGFLNITYKRGQGDFFCPKCRLRQPYVHKRVRRFCTFYFIPVIPLEIVSEHLQCQRCKMQFPLSKLNFSEEDDRRERRREFAGDVRRTMILMMIADGVVDEEEVAIVQQVYRRLAEEDLTRDQIMFEVEQAKRSGARAAHFARVIAARRTPEERDWVIRGAFLVASAHGSISPERMDELTSLPVALGMPAERFRQIIETVS